MSSRISFPRLVPAVLAFFAAVSVSPPAWPQNAVPPEPPLVTEGQAQPGANTLDLSSPRATIRTFFEAMGAVQAGSTERIEEAIACLYLDEELTGEDRLDQGAKAAHELYAVLDALQFVMTDIAEEVQGQNYTAELGSGETPVSLKLHRYEDGRWRFSSRTTEESSLEELRETVVEDEGEKETEGPGFVEALKSPRATMQTFIRGMNETDGLTQADALQALDLAYVHASVREETGKELAFQLKWVLDRVKRVEYSELPPESERPAFFFLRDSGGNIVLDVIEEEGEEPGEKAWKFTQATLEGLDALYLKYKDRVLAEGVDDRGQQAPFAVRMRDWLYDNDVQFLLKRTLYLQNWQWLGLFLVIVAGMTLSRILAFLLLAAIHRRFSRQAYTLNKKLGQGFVKPIRIALMAWFWLLGLTLLGAPPEARLYLKFAALAITAAGAIWALYRLIDIVGNYMAERAARSANKFDDLLVPIVTRSLKVFIVVVAVVMLAQQTGHDPTTIFAGLGLGGLAFALAGRDVVANVFGSFTILLDRPFQIGDWVKIGDIDGSVESVGIRSTRVRTFYNSLITVPNSELVNATVDNMGARRYRRIKTTLSIAYDTPPETIEAFCEGIRELIRRHPYTRKDYFHVYFNQFAAASLEILLYCFVETPDWGTELRERHRLFSDIVRVAQRLGVEFAFPTQTLYMRQEKKPEHGGAPSDPEAAFTLGRQQAQAIVEELLGSTGEKPPPVSFQPPPPNPAPADQRGEDTAP